MDILFPLGLILVGLVLLAGGGEALVRAATTIAEIAGVSPAVIGLTVVAIGTSLPELVVSLLAALRGEPVPASQTSPSRTSWARTSSTSPRRSGSRP